MNTIRLNLMTLNLRPPAIVIPNDDKPSKFVLLSQYEKTVSPSMTIVQINLNRTLCFINLSKCLL